MELRILEELYEKKAIKEFVVLCHSKDKRATEILKNLNTLSKKNLVDVIIPKNFTTDFNFIKTTGRATKIEQIFTTTEGGDIKACLTLEGLKQVIEYKLLVDQESKIKRNNFISIISIILAILAFVLQTLQILFHYE